MEKPTNVMKSPFETAVDFLTVHGEAGHIAGGGFGLGLAAATGMITPFNLLVFGAAGMAAGYMLTRKYLDGYTPNLSFNPTEVRQSPLEKIVNFINGDQGRRSLLAGAIVGAGTFAIGALPFTAAAVTGLSIGVAGLKFVPGKTVGR